MIIESEKTKVMTRNYGVDLLRILAMLGIVGLHILGHSGILGATQGTKYVVAWGLECFFISAVNVYAIISGFVGYKDIEYKFSRLINLWLMCVFYGVIIWAGYGLFSGKWEIRLLVQALLPVSSKEYWYFTAYVGVFCLAPLLNYIINSVSEKVAYKIFLGIMLLTIYATAVRVFGDTLTLKDGCTFVWLSLLYMIGGLIKRFNIYSKMNKTLALIIIGICFLSIWLWKLIFGMLDITILGSGIGGFFITYVSPQVFIMSALIVCLFSRLELNSKAEKVVVCVAPCTFAVYLIHDNPIIREYLVSQKIVWICDLNVVSFVNAIFVIIFFIFGICVVIEWGRRGVYKLLHIEQFIEKQGQFINRLLNRVLGILEVGFLKMLDNHNDNGKRE